jgi:hypothetical protein
MSFKKSPATTVLKNTALVQRRFFLELPVLARLSGQCGDTPMIGIHIAILKQVDGFVHLRKR